MLRVAAENQGINPANGSLVPWECLKLLEFCAHCVKGWNDADFEAVDWRNFLMEDSCRNGPIMRERDSYQTISVYIAAS
jgi:hypothetical protein